MFGLGMGEILLIAVVALLAVGPDRLPQAARSIGRGIRDLRRQTNDLQQALEQDSQIGDAVRELRSAWQGTAGSLPKNRHELGRALDQMTQVPAQERSDRAELPSPETADAQAPAGESAAQAASDSETTPAGAPVDPAFDPDDGLPPIKPPSGTIARSNAADVAPPSDGPPSDEPIDPPKPAHG
jgi:sec-independent protein translocase protein TatB